MKNGTNSSPDITFASSSLLNSCSWKVDIALGSDHLPILTSLTSTEVKPERIEAPKRVFINFNKADWQGFQQFTEDQFSAVTPTGDPMKDEKTFRMIINKASKRFIPAGRIPLTFNAMPTEAVRMMEERDRLRENNASEEAITTMNKDIQKVVNVYRKKIWTENLKVCDKNTTKLWGTIKAMNSPVTPSNQGLNFNNKEVDDPKDMADCFNKQYTPGNDKQATKEFRKTIRKFKNKKLKQAADPILITTDQVVKAIKKAKNSKALGPDNISPIMLKHIGQNGIMFLTEIYNNSVNTAIIPSLWKTGRIIPLLKPGKKADQGASYRPISLLSPAAKILESVLLPVISESVTLAPHQHGFRKKRSTVTALQDIAAHVTTGLNRKPPVHRTVVVAIDLSKAFDTVDHELLLKDISELPLNHNIKSFLSSYLRNRQTYVEFRGKKSNYRKMKQGVPQGGVLSPLLFNLYMVKMPLPPGTIIVSTYADDTTVMSSGVHIGPICEELNGYLTTLTDWFKGRNLQLSPAKSTATVFTSWSAQLSEELPIYIEGNQVPTVKNPKILGVTFDGMYNFGAHAKTVRAKLKDRNNLLRQLAGTTWGCSKETLLSTWKAIGKSTINYGCPIYGPSLSQSSWDDIQVDQNTGLKICTGAYKSASKDHVHAETKCMPVKEHCEMLNQQFLLASQLTDHPTTIDLDILAPQRQLKRTLVSEYADKVRDYVPEEGLSLESYKSAIKSIHTSCVQEAIAAQGINHVLGTIPPEVHKSEITLPRSTRATLTQLRSGFSKSVNSYMSIIDPTISNNCPDCDASPHDIDHLFACISKPTNLTTRSLWNCPKEAAQFLGLDTTTDIWDNG